MTPPMPLTPPPMRPTRTRTRLSNGAQKWLCALCVLGHGRNIPWVTSLRTAWMDAEQVRLASNRNVYDAVRAKIHRRSGSRLFQATSRRVGYPCAWDTPSRRREHATRKGTGHHGEGANDIMLRST